LDQNQGLDRIEVFRFKFLMHNADIIYGYARASTDASMSRVAKQAGQLLLNHRQQQHHDRGDDRDRITSARQAAEALFTLKPQPLEPSVSDPAPSAERPARKPRILPVSSPPPVRNEEGCGTGQPRAPDHASGPAVAPRPHPNLGEGRVDHPSAE
jgi:hypothetical protein